MLPHDLTIAVIGGLILWFGWYGFNPCSTLSIMDNAGVGRVATNTTLAACTGGLAADLRDVLPNEEVGRRLPSSTASSPAWWRSPARATGSATLGACVIGAVAGVLVIAGDGPARASPHRRSRSAPGRFTACAASGARCRWACSPAASTHAAGSSPFGVPVDRSRFARSAHRPVLRRRHEGPDGAVRRQR